MLPNLASCPYDSLQFKYGASTGFLGVHISSASVRSPAMMTVTFFDDGGNTLYTFTKSPTREQALAKGSAASSSSAIFTLSMFGALFLVVAVGLCLVGVSRQARRALLLAAPSSSGGLPDRSRCAPRAAADASNPFAGERGKDGRIHRPWHWDD